jgi:preprotein translocase subunit YajC
MSQALSLTVAAATAAAPSPALAFVMQTLPFVLILLIFYFLMIRPQQQRAKAHQAMLAAVKKGDDVITGGGIRGRVSRVIDETEAEIEIAQGVKVRVVKSTLSQVINPTAKPAND